MNNFIKSLTILLHAIVITALLSNLSMSEPNSTVKLQQNSTQFFYPTATIATTDS